MSERAIRDVQARFGVGMTPMRTLATQAQVMRLNSTMSVGEFQSLVSTLETDPDVEYAHADVLLKPQETIPVPNDPLYPYQLGRHLDLRVRNFNAGPGGTVAVVDSGVRPHGDLVTNLIGGYDFITDPFIANDGNGRDASPLDPGDFAAAGACGPGKPATNSTWHGTHVAGMIGAMSNNAYGIAGLGQQNTLVIPIRAVGRCGGHISDVAEAVLWAAGIPVPGVPVNLYPARVINLSLSTEAPCLPTAQAVINTVRNVAGATVVVAAGNANVDAANFLPANCDGVIVVAALTRNGSKAPYSNFGSLVDIAAPGGDFTLGPTQGVISTTNAGTTGPGADAFGFKQGTSMAAAHVSAIATLMSVWGTYTPDQMENMLKLTTPQGTGPCEFPKCIRAINDYGAVREAVAPQGIYIAY